MSVHSGRKRLWLKHTWTEGLLGNRSQVWHLQAKAGNLWLNFAGSTCVCVWIDSLNSPTVSWVQKIDLVLGFLGKLPEIQFWGKQELLKCGNDKAFLLLAKAHVDYFLVKTWVLRKNLIGISKEYNCCLTQSCLELYVLITDVQWKRKSHDKSNFRGTQIKPLLHEKQHFQTNYSNYIFIGRVQLWKPI